MWSAYLPLRNEADAEEAAQEALLKAFSNLRQLRGESTFGSWLMKVGINEARMRLKKRQTEIMTSIEQQQDEDGNYMPQDFRDWREIPCEALELKEVRRILMNRVAALAPKYREVLVLRDVQQMSIHGTAQVLGISQQAVKSRLLCARLMLRDLLASGFDGLLVSKGVSGKGVKPWS